MGIFSKMKIFLILQECLLYMIGYERIVSDNTISEGSCL